MRVTILPIVIGLIFSGGFVAGRYTTYDLGPLTVTFSRFAIGVLLLGAFVWFKKEPLKIKAPDLWKFLVLAVFGVIGYHFLYYQSLALTMVTNAGIISAFSPVVTGVLAALFMRERLDRQHYVGIVLALAGVLLVLTRGDLSILLSLSFNPGDLFMVTAVFSWAIYALTVRHLSERYSSLMLLFWSSVIGLVGLVPLILLEDGYRALAMISLPSLWSILYIGVMSSCFAYLLYNVSIEKIGATRTSSAVYSSVAVLVAILSFLFFGEQMTISLFISMVLVIVGMRMVLHESKPARS